ncbi:MAG: hypothetical protein A2Z20_00725 [Bdellovibrionales bacterium RBG_16_40_8]|nr:MAG: hypothetical protein A2Z20_00725 [Bdellovibrionales bacterium RBG_16_40_8]
MIESCAHTSIRKSTDDELINRTNKIISEERQITAELLLYLREIERRMLYAKMGYPSIYELLTKHFNYSGGAAYRRISAMRLIQDVPEVEEKVKSGALSLTTAAKMQTFFREMKFEKKLEMKNSEKKKFIEQVENLSTQDVDKLLRQIAPDLISKDRVRTLSESHVEIKFIANVELKNKLEYLKNLLSNKMPVAGYKEIIDEASDIAIEKLDPLLRQKLRRANPLTDSQCVTSKINMLEGFKKQIEEVEGAARQRVVISADLKRKVWARDGGVCSFRRDSDEKICGSRYQLEFDHIVPIARGGSTSIENLRLLCKAHNIFEAKRIFGEKHIAQFVKKLE